MKIYEVLKRNFKETRCNPGLFMLILGGGYKVSLIKGYFLARSVDGEFYAEGVLKVYSFPGKVVVYLREQRGN